MGTMIKMCTFLHLLSVSLCISLNLGEITFQILSLLYDWFVDTDPYGYRWCMWIFSSYCRWGRLLSAMQIVANLLVMSLVAPLRLQRANSIWFKFQVRYESRKNLAERRPRFRGQFVQQSTIENASEATDSWFRAFAWMA